MANTKIAVLIHGYPEPIYKNSPLYVYFENNGYEIIAPYLFDSKFKLNPDNVTVYIKEKLKGRAPSVIVGLSLGGLLAPHLAKEFPKAKLVLMATGPKISCEVNILNEVINMKGKSVLLPLLEVAKFCPTWLYSLIYRLVNHSELSEKEKKELENHIVKNWKCITSLDLEEDLEVLDFLSHTDNTVLLHSLKNKTLIFAGDGDVMMPSILSKKLKSLIRNSKLIINSNRLHFSVFTSGDEKYLNEFLN